MAVFLVRWPVAGAPPHQRNDVSLLAVTLGPCELVSEVGRVSERKVQEKLQVHQCTVACASLHRSR